MTLRTFFKLLPGLAAIPFVVTPPKKVEFVTGWDVGVKDIHAALYRRIDEGMEKSLQEYKQWAAIDRAYENPMMTEALVDLQNWILTQKWPHTLKM